jgi:CHAT domain-containing protein
LGKASGGEGFLGFSQAFFVSGARSLVLSLWKVDDTATALLMLRFYENLLGSRAATSPGCRERFSSMSKVEAMREAKLWLRDLRAPDVRTLCKIHELALPNALARGEPGPMRPAETPDHPFEHPYYWSAFILVGDPD